MAPEDVDAARDAYLKLLKASLLGHTVGPVTVYRPVTIGGRRDLLAPLLGRTQMRIAKAGTVDASTDVDGRAFVSELAPGVMTMIGSSRLEHLETCMLDVIAGGVPGDFIETGVWRGGATIFMRGVLKAHGITDRRVFVADSFAGLPPPNAEDYPADNGMSLHLFSELAVSVDDVKANFARYGLLDDQVRFVKGWFRDSLPALRDHTWAVVRLDGDLYESTMDGLTNLYPGLAPGGWLIVDDYEIPACMQAVTDFRADYGIDEALTVVDWTAVAWKKSTERVHLGSQSESIGQRCEPG